MTTYGPVPYFVHVVFIEIGVVAGHAVARVSYFDQQGVRQESALMRIDELDTLIAMWSVSGLMGSFGIGTQLTKDVIIMHRSLPEY